MLRKLFGDKFLTYWQEAIYGMAENILDGSNTSPISHYSEETKAIVCK